MRKRASKRGTSEHAEHVAGGVESGPRGVAAQLRPRLVVAAILTVPVFLISMVPALQFPDWGWVAGALALPVVSWAAWPFHRAAAVNARHFASTMDTLVSIGVTAAYLFSVWQLAADPRMTEHPGMEGMAGRRPVLRGRRRCHHLPAAGPLPRGERQAEGRRRAQGAAEPGRQGRHRAPGRHRATGSPPISSGGRRHRGPARREDRHGRRGDRWHLRGRRLPGDRRIGARGGRPGQPRHGRHHQHLRPAPGPRHPRGLGNHAGPDGAGWCPRRRPARPPSPGLRTGSARVFVPVVLVIAGLTFAAWLLAAAARRSACRAPRGLHGRRRRAGHRLPLRPGARHPGGPPHRHRPRRPAGHPDQGPAGPGGHPDRGHHPAGQDRHRHHRPPCRGRHRGVRRPSAEDDVLRLAGAVEAASEHPDRPRHRRRGTVRREAGTTTAALPAVDGLPFRPGRRCPGTVEGRHVLRAARAGCRKTASRLTPGQQDALGRPPKSPAPPRSGSRWTGNRPASSACGTRSSPVRLPRSPGCGSWGCGPSC